MWTGKGRGQAWDDPASEWEQEIETDKEMPIGRLWHVARSDAQRQTVGLVQVLDLEGGEWGHAGWMSICTSREQKRTVTR